MMIEIYKQGETFHSRLTEKKIPMKYQLSGNVAKAFFEGNLEQVDKEITFEQIRDSGLSGELIGMGYNKGKLIAFSSDMWASFDLDGYSLVFEGVTFRSVKTIYRCNLSEDEIVIIEANEYASSNEEAIHSKTRTTWLTLIAALFAELNIDLKKKGQLDAITALTSLSDANGNTVVCRAAIASIIKEIKEKGFV